MAKVSVLIPSRNEIYLPQTIDDLFAKASGEIEVIVTLDGYWPTPPLKAHLNLILLHRPEPRGMRDAINSAAAISTGKYLMKTDAHCMFGEGFDEILQKDCADNWIVVPRRYSLDADKWAIKQDRPITDYHYLSFPWNKPDEPGLHGERWGQRAVDRKAHQIDDEMSSQGSCWFMSRAHFNRLGGLSEDGYGRFVQEFQEIGLKTWLGPWDGACKVNKKTWYAHLHKGKQLGRMYYISKKEMVNGTAWSLDYWMNNRWPERKHDIPWLIEKFWPVPTWPDSWREQFYGGQKSA